VERTRIADCADTMIASALGGSGGGSSSGGSSGSSGSGAIILNRSSIPTGCKAWDILVIPASVTKISPNSFQDYQNKSINIAFAPGCSITTIESSTYESLTINATYEECHKVQFIDGDAFYEVSGNLILPCGIERVDEDAFVYSSGLDVAYMCTGMYVCMYVYTGMCLCVGWQISNDLGASSLHPVQCL